MWIHIQLISFCESVQRKSPVGAHIRPIPGRTPGYGHEVIFADGTFTEGSTLELSADGPLREPFVAFSQVVATAFQNISNLSTTSKCDRQCLQQNSHE